MNNKVTHTFKVDPSSWMRSHESAFLRIKSPRGGVVYIYKAKHFNSRNNDPEHAKFVELFRTKLIGSAEHSSTPFEVELTVTEAVLIHKYTKL